MTPRKRRLLLLPALTLVVLALAGCRLRADIGVDVDADGGGTLTVSLTADDELRRAARQAGGDPLRALADETRSLRGWGVTTSDDGRTVTLRTAFADPDELERASGQFAAALAAPELRPLGPLRVVVTDDTVELRGSAGLRPTRAVRELGVRPRRARAVLRDAVRVRVAARMPGPVLETDADHRPDADTAAWTIAAGQQRRLTVVARRPWTLARLVALAVTPWTMAALLVGVALVVECWRTTRNRPFPAG